MPLCDLSKTQLFAAIIYTSLYNLYLLLNDKYSEKARENMAMIGKPNEGFHLRAKRVQ
jgi:hypothetical protein